MISKMKRMVKRKEKSDESSQQKPKNSSVNTIQMKRFGNQRESVSDSKLQLPSTTRRSSKSSMTAKRSSFKKKTTDEQYIKLYLDLMNHISPSPKMSQSHRFPSLVSPTNKEERNSNDRQISKLEKQLEKANQECSSLNQKLEMLKEENSTQLRKTKKEYEKEISSIYKELTDVIDERDRLKVQVNERAAMRLKKELQHMRKRLDISNSQVELLKDQLIKMKIKLKEAKNASDSANISSIISDLMIEFEVKATYAKDDHEREMNNMRQELEKALDYIGILELKFVNKQNNSASIQANSDHNSSKENIKNIPKDSQILMQQEKIKEKDDEIKRWRYNVDFLREKIKQEKKEKKSLKCKLKSFTTENSNNKCFFDDSLDEDCLESFAFDKSSKEFSQTSVLSSLTWNDAYNSSAENLTIASRTK